jgi:MoxR-like ATPase
MPELVERFDAFRAAANTALVEREDEVDAALVALVAGEHLLFVGPPGCAKSLMIDSLCAWLAGTKFSLLLTKFTQPEEVFGPISLAGLKEDRFVRVTAGRLPEAELAVLDEIFKGSSAILNTLLKVLNEGTFDRGDGVPTRCPLLLCLAASNEWPQEQEGGKELGALFDRFVIRKTVRPVSTAAGRERLLWSPHALPSPEIVSPNMVREARRLAAALPYSGEAKEALHEVLRSLAREGVRPGDRRQVKAVGVARAAAWLAGSAEVRPEHLEPLAHVLWDDPREQPQKAAQVVARIANPAGMAVNGLLLEAEEAVAGADLRNMAAAAACDQKLKDVVKKLKDLKGDKARRAEAHVTAEIKKLRRSLIEGLS